MTEKSTKQELLKVYKQLGAEIVLKKLALPDEAHGITTKSVKSDILAAIHAMEATLKANTERTTTGNRARTEQKLPEQKNVVPCEDVSDYDLTSAKPVEPAGKTPRSVKKQEADCNEGDNDLRYLNQEIIEKIEALEAAKTLKKKEYANLLLVEENLLKFVEMINQKKAESLAQAESQKNRKEAQAKEIEELRSQHAERREAELEQAKAELETLKESITERDSKLSEERAVEEEAYEYKIRAEQQKEDDAWNDTVAHAEEQLSDVEKEICAAQTALKEKEDYRKELEAKIAQLPELLRQAEEEGATAKEKELGKEYGYKSSKSKKESENAIQALQEEIELLRKDFEDAIAEKQSIQAKLDKAYEENNKLYMQTVQSTGGVKILHNTDKS